MAGGRAREETTIDGMCLFYNTIKHIDLRAFISNVFGIYLFAVRSQFVCVRVCEARECREEKLSCYSFIIKQAKNNLAIAANRVCSRVYVQYALFFSCSTFPHHSISNVIFCRPYVHSYVCLNHCFHVNASDSDKAEIATETQRQ